MLPFTQSRKNDAYYQLLGDSTSLAWRRRLLEHWLKLALGLAIVLNIILARLYFVTESRRPTTPLDNYQILKPALSIVAPTSPAPSSSQRAVVTTLYNDAFALPVAVLGHSLASANVTARRIILVMPDRLSARALCIVRAAGWQPHEVPFIPPPRDGKGVHPRFLDQFTKLNIWRLDALGVTHAVYLDGDTLVRQNIDELFELPFPFAAVPDVFGEGDPRGFPISFNAGVLALRPATATFDALMRALPTANFPLIDAEQAFLNLYYAAEVARLSYAYNGNLAIKRRSPALWEALRPVMSIVHYTWPTPFTKDAGAGIQSEQAMMKAVDVARRARNGLHREEIDWWVDEWQAFESEERAALSQCNR